MLLPPPRRRPVTSGTTRPPAAACGTVGAGQAWSLKGSSDARPGVMMSSPRSVPPTSSRATRRLGSSLRRAARTHPALPAPTITTSNSSDPVVAVLPSDMLFSSVVAEGCPRTGASTGRCCCGGSQPRCRAAAHALVGRTGSAGDRQQCQGSGRAAMPRQSPHPRDSAPAQDHGQTFTASPEGGQRPRWPRRARRRR